MLNIKGVYHALPSLKTRFFLNLSILYNVFLYLIISTDTQFCGDSLTVF